MSEKNYKIYVKNLNKWIEATPDEYRDFYRDIWAVHDKAKNHGHCKCPRRSLWRCDGDCLSCEFYSEYGKDMVPLDAETETGASYGDMLEAPDAGTEEAAFTGILLRELFSCLKELDPQAEVICELLMEGASFRQIAKKLGRPQKTFNDQMKRYRHELRKLCGENN